MSKDQSYWYDEDAAAAAEEEWDLLHYLLREEGFQNYGDCEWIKFHHDGEKFVSASFDGDTLQFNFNDTQMVNVSIPFVIDFFQNKPHIFKRS